MIDSQIDIAIDTYVYIICIAKIIAAKIRRLNVSGKFPEDIRIPPLKLKILLESSPLKFREYEDWP